MFSIKQNVGKWLFWAGSGLLLFDLLNPWLKKYDYGAGYPVLALFVVVLAGVAVWRLRVLEKRMVTVEVAVLIGLVAAVISWWWSGAFAVGFSDFLAMSGALIGYLLLARSDLRVEKVAKVVVVAVLIACAIGFGLYLGFDELRMFGPFFNKDSHAHTWPNAFALFLLLSWPFLLFVKKRFWRTFFVVVALSALWLTFSRGALIAFGGQLVLLVILFRSVKWREMAVVAVLVLALVSGVNGLRGLNFEVESAAEKASFEADEGKQSTSDRVAFWQGAVDLSLEKPLFGYGPFSFRQAYAGKQTELLQTADHPHNFFLKLAAEYGLIFLMVWLFILFELLWRFWRGEKDLEAKVLFVAAAGGLAHNLIDYNLNFLSNLALLVLCLGLLRAKFRSGKLGRNVAVKVAAILFALLAVYDVGMQFAALKKPELARYLLYPREQYVSLERNELSSEARYELGLAEEAIALNPLNEFKYYLLAVEQGGDYQRVIPLLEQYFVKVKFNENFTAYSENVEYAAKLIEAIVARDSSYGWLLDKKEEMWKDALHARKFQQL